MASTSSGRWSRIGVSTTFVHKVENRRNAGSHPQGSVAELKSKNDRTAVLPGFYNGEIAVSKNQTGQQ
jgi:hypothetical protein